MGVVSIQDGRACVLLKQGLKAFRNMPYLKLMRFADDSKIDIPLNSFPDILVSRAQLEELFLLVSPLFVPNLQHKCLRQIYTKPNQKND